MAVGGWEAGGWSGLGIFDFQIFAFGGLGGESGLGESWQIKPHLEKRRFRRDMATFRSIGGVWGTPCGIQTGGSEGEGSVSVWEPVRGCKAVLRSRGEAPEQTQGA